MRKTTDKNQLAESFVPNSIAYKKTSLEKAKETLLIAKAIPRTVRKAKPNECDFSRERERLLNAEPREIKKREDGLISLNDAVELYGVSKYTVHLKRKQELIKFKKENGKFYYDLEDLLREAKTKHNKEHND